MSEQFEVPEPIICSPYDEPAEHWRLEKGQAPVRESGRRPSHYYYRDPSRQTAEGEAEGAALPLPLVNLVRQRLVEWRDAGYPGASMRAAQALSGRRRGSRHLATPPAVAARG